MLVGLQSLVYKAMPVCLRDWLNHLRVVPSYATWLLSPHGRSSILSELNVLHLFTYRDPRDVVVSEAHYLAEMNRWHRLHRHYAQLDSLEERVSLAISGVEGKGETVDYPTVATRFPPYAGWLAETSVLALRYEDLTGEGRAEALTAIADAYEGACVRELDLQSTVAGMEAAIAPEKSHTYREWGSGGWRKVFTD